MQENCTFSIIPYGITMSKIFSFLFKVPNDSTISFSPHSSIIHPFIQSLIAHSLIAHRFHPHLSCRAQLYTICYFIAMRRRCRADNTLSAATGFRPRKVVRSFRSSRGIESNNLAIHSSAKELLTTLTPSKSSTTRSLPFSNGNNSSLACLPSGRVPRFSPKRLNSNVTIVALILYRSKIIHYIVLHNPCDWLLLLWYLPSFDTAERLYVLLFNLNY